MSIPWLTVTYLIYIIMWDGFVVGGCAYAVFWLGHSGWWFALAMVLAALAYRPSSWRELLGPNEQSS